MALSCFAPHKIARSQPAAARIVKVDAQKKEATVAVTTATLLAANPTLAADSVGVGDIVSGTGSALGKAGEILGQGFEVSKEAYEKYGPVVKEGYERAAPVVKDAAEATVKTVGPLVKQLSPLVQQATGGLEKTLQEQGLDTATVKSTVSTVGGQAVKTTTPLLQQLFNFIVSSDPILLAEYGVAAVVAVLLGPRLLGVAAGALRGYGGEVSAAAVLDNVVTDGSSYIVDIRSARDKEMGGVPDLPGGASNRCVELEFCITENKRVRGQLRNPDEVETKMTAMQIAALKRLSTRDTLYLLDKDGGLARRVARELASRGFGKTFVVAGGFDGRNGWSKSKLQIKPAATQGVGGAVFGGRLGTVVTGRPAAKK